MELFHETLKQMEQGQHLLAIKDDKVVETYDGRETKVYIGEYETDGDCCSCSHYKNKLFCRHLLFFREQMALPMFETSMFHRIHLTEGTTGAIYDEDEQLVVIDNNDVTHHEPVSPGTAELLLEEREKKIRWSKQLKFNKAFDVHFCAAVN